MKTMSFFMYQKWKHNLEKNSNKIIIIYEQTKYKHILLPNVVFHILK